MSRARLLSTLRKLRGTLDEAAAELENEIVDEGIPLDADHDLMEARARVNALESRVSAMESGTDESRSE